MNRRARLLVIVGAAKLLLPVAAHAESLRVTKTLAELLNLHQELEAYRISHRAYPQSLDDLEEARLIDAWGHPFVYRRDEANLVLYSIGKNGSNEGGYGDDIVSYNLLNREFYPELDRPLAGEVWASVVGMSVVLVAGVYFLVQRQVRCRSQPPREL